MFPNSKYLFTEDDNKKAPGRLKSTYTNALREKVWRKQAFIKLAPEAGPVDANGYPTDIASHSGRKCPAEYATNSGASSNEVEIRGRWKGQKGGRVVFRYINVQQLYEDARVASLLCRGGPVRYTIKEGVQITDGWLFEHVVPNIRRRFPNDARLCRVMALSLLYICLQHNEEICVPAPLRNRVKDAYTALGLAVEEPIEKMALHVYRGPNGVFGIGDAVSTGTTGAVTVGGEGVVGMGDEVGQTILVRMNVLEQAHTQSQLNHSASISELRSYTSSQFRVLNNNIRAFGGTIQGSLVRQRASNRGVLLSGTDTPQSQLQLLVETTPATLSSNPRTLQRLWHEYKFGINGRKAAEHFTTAEKNANKRIKQKYWRRDVVWQTIARLVRGGRTVQVAIHQIQNAYGYETSITKLVNVLLLDKGRYPGGIHPSLR